MNRRGNTRPGRPAAGASALAVGTLCTACALLSQNDVRPQLSAASPGAIKTNACSNVAAGFSYAETILTAATTVRAGEFAQPGVTSTSPEHCLIAGKMGERSSVENAESFSCQ